MCLIFPRHVGCRVLGIGAMKRVLERSSARRAISIWTWFVNYEILTLTIFSGAALESPIVVGDQNKNLILSAAVHTRTRIHTDTRGTRGTRTRTRTRTQAHTDSIARV